MPKRKFDPHCIGPRRKPPRLRVTGCVPRPAAGPGRSSRPASARRVPALSTWPANARSSVKVSGSWPCGLGLRRREMYGLRGTPVDLNLVQDKPGSARQGRRHAFGLAAHCGLDVTRLFTEARWLDPITLVGARSGAGSRYGRGERRGWGLDARRGARRGRGGRRAAPPEGLGVARTRPRERNDRRHGGRRGVRATRRAGAGDAAGRRFRPSCGRPARQPVRPAGRAGVVHRAQPLCEVARACGFADQSHMTRVVRAMRGSPPGRSVRESAFGGAQGRL
jgi:AraC-like DNA-binding protein